tara:strand:- start:36 stop:1040 length:1005 start_codon:yes stop_codon:yes gene_type:complete
MNLLPYSEDFSNAAWTKSNSSITSNSVISPDGTLNADKLIENTSNASHQVYKTVITNSGDFSNSIFVKSAERSKIRINSGSNSDRVDFDLSNGTVISEVGATGSIVSISNGWYKCDISWNTVTVSAQYFLISLLDDSGTQSYTGNGTSGVYIWGAQVEQGSYATSYIPNFGNSAGATRSADVCINAGNNQVINSTEGTIYGEQKSLETDFSYNYFSAVSDGTNNNRLEIRQAGTSLQFLWRVGGTYQAAITLSNAPFSSTIKYALRYSSTDIKFYVNGSLVNTINSPTLYSAETLNNIQFADGVGTTNFRGTVKECKYYNTALTDQELINLTTI